MAVLNVTYQAHRSVSETVLSVLENVIMNGREDGVKELGPFKGKVRGNLEVEGKITDGEMGRGICTLRTNFVTGLI